MPVVVRGHAPFLVVIVDVERIIAGPRAALRCRSHIVIVLAGNGGEARSKKQGVRSQKPEGRKQKAISRRQRGESIQNSRFQSKADCSRKVGATTPPSPGLKFFVLPGLVAGED